MEKSKWLELQNGSDIRGIASDGVQGQAVNLTPAIVETIAVSFVLWLSERKGLPPEKLTVSVGRDSRISGPSLMKSFIQGLLSAGASAVDCGIASTPAMFMSTVLEKCQYDGAVMLTASHLPFNRNGIKFFTNLGGLDKPDITKILELASDVVIEKQINSKCKTYDLITDYANFLADKIRKEVKNPKPLSGFRIVVDAGNGAGGFFADKVLKPLGADTAGSQFLDPDGMFPNHIPNPEDETAMESIQKAVVANKADLGIIFDTDVDRAAAVDNLGNGINRNNLIALIGAIILEEHPGTTIVTDSITSDGLSEFIEMNLKGKHHRFKRGYKNVINEAIRLNIAGEPCWLAIETSGHAALKENFFLDDGAYLITKVLIKAAQMKLAGKNLMDLTAKLRIPVESKEFRLTILESDFRSYGMSVIKDLGEYVKTVPGWEVVPNNFEGLRISCDQNSGNGWFLLRLSLHDPVIPLNIESDRVGGVKEILHKLNIFLEKYPDSALNKTAVKK